MREVIKLFFMDDPFKAISNSIIKFRNKFSTIRKTKIKPPHNLCAINQSGGSPFFTHHGNLL